MFAEHIPIIYLSLPETPSARKKRPMARDDCRQCAAPRTLERPVFADSEDDLQWVWTLHGRRLPTRGNQSVMRERSSGGATFVVMVQIAEMRDVNDRAACRRLRCPRDGSILVEREMRSPGVVVGEVLPEVAPQRAFVPHDDVVEALAPQ